MYANCAPLGISGVKSILCVLVVQRTNLPSFPNTSPPSPAAYNSTKEKKHVQLENSSPTTVSSSFISGSVLNMHIITQSFSRRYSQLSVFGFQSSKFLFRCLPDFGVQCDESISS